MYEVSYNGRTSCVSNDFYRHIRPERLLYDAEHDLLAIAKCLVYTRQPRLQQLACKILCRLLEMGVSNN